MAFQNIKNQFTLGIGLGYTLVDNEWVEWDVSSGPAYTRVECLSVLELSSRVDFKYDYKLTWADKKAGTYKHHMVAALENELTSWLDIEF